MKKQQKIERNFDYAHLQSRVLAKIVMIPDPTINRIPRQH